MKTLFLGTGLLFLQQYKKL